MISSNTPLTQSCHRRIEGDFHEGELLRNLDLKIYALSDYSNFPVSPS